MSVTYEEVTGGMPSPTVAGGSPSQQPIIDYKVEFPDTISGQNVTFSGFISPALAAGGLGPAVALSGSPIALPSVPGGGLSLNWILQVNLTTGAVTMKTGTAATTGTQVTPSPDAGNLTIFVHTITNGDTIPWLRAPTTTDLNPV
jgi:hypothetical protein